MRHLFAYGSLMCPDIMQRVSGLTLVGVAATAHGYRRCKVRGEPYPAVLADSDASVNGILYRNLSEAAWHRLDRFEGEMYRRVAISVDTADATIAAGLYLAHPDFHHRLLADDWSFEEFLDSGRKQFEHEYSGFETL
jgi:gamma-glutamylcyclotransferase (GGCT)/AIG2-like uncharacterized protein YtfP